MKRAGIACLAALGWLLPAPAPARAGEPAPVASASTSAPGGAPALAVDGDAASAWRSAPGAQTGWLALDLGAPRALGALVIDWSAEDSGVAYQVELSDDATTWQGARRVDGGNGGRDPIFLGCAEARHLRLSLERSSRGRGYAVADIRLLPCDEVADANGFFRALARDAPRGAYPKYFLREQSYWTVVGADADADEALLDAQGLLEVDERAFALEPFLRVEDRLVSWSNAEIEQSLLGGDLPVPVVRWRAGALSLEVRAFAAGPAGASVLYASYRVGNAGPGPRRAELFLAVRPFQVLPPWQALNVVGGVSRIHEIAAEGRVVWVTGEAGRKALICLSEPDGFGALRFEQGGLDELLGAGRLPEASRVRDETGFAWGALRYALDLPAGSHAEVHVAVPFHDPAPFTASLPAAAAAPTHVAARLEETLREWRARLPAIDLRLPPAAGKLRAALRSAVAHVLVNRDGAALQAGPRCYARSWIRDGAFITSALLQVGLARESADYLRWYATFQYEDGKVPCCIDGRGADPTPEHDSAGAFVYAAVEHYRMTRDAATLRALWPHLARAVAYLERLRAQRTRAEYRTPEKRAFYGILPESISHEGYVKRPVHSYWDDFFALRGFADAALAARALGLDEEARRLEALRDAFRLDLAASIEATMQRHGVDYVPASVELGDFDPTATSFAVAPGGEQALLPAAALARTYARYLEELRLRLAGDAAWEAYTPYELRNVEALLRLGRRDDALALLRAILADQRPAGWNQWPEVVFRDPAWPRFVGDMPHAWVGAEFIRAARSLFVYERAGEALVLAAGVPPEWIASEGGVAVHALPTHWGPLSYQLRAAGARAAEVAIAAGVEIPAGGIVVHAPVTPLRGARVEGGGAIEHDAASVTVRALPARVRLEW